MADYVELHCHSNFSFLDGASSIEDLVLTAKELGYTALALTDHDNLCGAMAFAQTCRAFGLKSIVGAEVTLQGGQHLILLARDHAGYSNLCRLLSLAHVTSPRREPALDMSLLRDHTSGLFCLSGCARGQIPSLLAGGKWEEARTLAQRYQEWFGEGGFYLELQNNLSYGDRERNRKLISLAQELGIRLVATNNVHYHVRERHRLQDALVAIKRCKTLEETHRERRPNSEFFLKPKEDIASLFDDCPQALESTLFITDSCTFDLTQHLDYCFPDYPIPDRHTVDSYLQELCYQAALRRYGEVSPRVRERLEEELRRIRKHGLSGFFLIYHDILKLGREAAVELGLSHPDTPLEEDPPGRGRGSSVALLVGYLIGLSHIDPLLYDLGLERFLPEDLAKVPDVDLDFPRNIREKLIEKVHAHYGWQHAALTGMISTYQIKGAIRDLGKALGLPEQEIDTLAKKVDHGSARELQDQMASLPGFKDRVEAPVWRDLVELARELDGFPKYLAQHPGGMIISSRPLIDLVPVQRGAMEGRYICQWDKDSIEDAQFIKIDFLALGALSQMQECLQLIEARHGAHIDISRIDFEDAQVYDMLGRGDTIGIFQVESAAQLQTIVRLKPQNLVDMAYEVALVRPGVGVSGSTHTFLDRRLSKEGVSYDNQLEERALGRTLGAILYQDQVNQLAIDVAGFSENEADQMRRAFSKRNNQRLIAAWWERFREGASAKGVPEEAARRIFRKFNGEYMFPESHAYAFGVTAYQMAWLKHYHPLEFYVALFNQQPMGFYSLESLKEDARRHGIAVLNPDINLSQERCTIHNESLLLGLLNVLEMGQALASQVVREREERGPYSSLAAAMQRTGLPRRILENLADAGAFDVFDPDRRRVKWEIGLRYQPNHHQLSLPLPVEPDIIALSPETSWEALVGEYHTLALSPQTNVMAELRHSLPARLKTSRDLVSLKDGDRVEVAGVVIRRQCPWTPSGVVFFTLEDEYGHIPLVLWQDVYQKYRQVAKEALLTASGQISRRDGTLNVVVSRLRKVRIDAPTLKAKEWR